MNDSRTTEQEATKKRVYWYEIYRDECPGCGHYSEWRERRYGPKPQDRREYDHFQQSWCGCCYE